MCYLVMLSITKSGNGDRWMSMEWWWNETVEGNWSACPCRIKHPIDTLWTTNLNGLAWDRTWSSIVRRQWLNAWVMVWPTSSAQ
jgi:hypothetical protein